MQDEMKPIRPSKIRKWAITEEASKRKTTAEFIFSLPWNVGNSHSATVLKVFGGTSLSGLLQNLTGSEQRSNEAVLSFLSAEFNPDAFKNAIQAFL